MPRIGRERVICLPHELSVFSALLFNGKGAILGAYRSFSQPLHFPLVVLMLTFYTTVLKRQYTLW